MSERVRWIEHGSHKILVMDFSGLKDEQLFKAIDAAYAAYKNKASRSTRSLTVLSDTPLFGQGLERMKKFAKDTDGFDEKSAIIGLNVAKKVMLNVLNPFLKTKIKPFNSQEDAINWLAEDK